VCVESVDLIKLFHEWITSDQKPLILSCDISSNKQDYYLGVGQFVFGSFGGVFSNLPKDEWPVLEIHSCAWLRFKAKSLPMKSSVLFYLIAVALALHLSAEEHLSRKAPETVKNEILPHLTSLEKVLEKSSSAIIDDDSGVLLLREKYFWVADSGKRFRVYHTISQAKTEQGIEYASKDIFSYDPLLYKLHLVSARTVLPDGTIKELAENAAFLQRGRSEESSQTYHSDRELVLIHPDVKVGSIIETIVVYEDITARIEGQFLSSLSFYPGWPIQQDTNTVDMPKNMFDKLTIHSIGAGTPKLKHLKSKKNRVRVSWDRKNVPASDYEPDRAPTNQVGPAVQMTTLASWDHLAEWYNGLLKPQSILSDALKNKADAWTKGISDREKIISILFQHVANDVRYTGLEFGDSGLQPYDCNQVWRNQYGDCKDKSNLLCALLSYKKIPAYVTLINTQHKGIIQHEVPSYMAFDHAITAIPSNSDNKEFIFCDPTISYGKPGMLAPSSSNRESLVVTGDKATWVKTPSNHAGSLNYDFDLKLDDHGVLEGWLTLSSAGYYSIGTGERYHGLDRLSVIRSLNQLIDNYFTGALVADYVIAKPTHKQFEDPVIIKAYFTCPRLQPDDKGRLHIDFPHSKNMVMDYGTIKTRKTDYFQWPDDIRVSSRIELPAGWNIDSSPAPFEAITPYYDARAKWSSGSGSQHLSSDWQLKVITDTIPAQKIAVVQQANRSMKAWMQKSALLTQNEGSGVVDRPEVEMSLMPTGEGQLELAHRLYPLTGRRELREQAFEKVIQLFPEDTNTQFISRARIAYIAYYHNDYKVAQALYSGLLKNVASDADRDEANLARYLHAVVEYELGNRTLAISQLKTLSQQSMVSPYRLGWTYSMLGDYLAEDDTTRSESIVFYQKALTIENDHSSHAIQGFFLQLCLGGDLVESSKILSEWLKNNGDQSLDTMDELLVTLLSQTEPGVWETAAKSSRSVLQALAKTATVNLTEKLKKFSEALENKALFSRNNHLLRKELLDLIKELQPSYLIDQTIPQEHDTQAKVESYMDEQYNENHKAWLNAVSHYFHQYQPNEKFTHYLWQLLTYVDWQEHKATPVIKEEFYLPMVKLSEKISHKDGNYWECQFAIASWHESLEQWDEAIEIYDSMIIDPDWSTDFDHACWNRLGHALERTGQWQRAASCYTRFASERGDYSSVCEHLLRAGLLQLRLGKRQQALETWQLLVDTPIAAWQESDESDDIQVAISLAQKPDVALEYWKSTQVWWDENYLAACQDVEVNSKAPYPPYTTETAPEIEQSILGAQQEKSFGLFLKALMPVADSARWLPHRLIDLYTLGYANSQAFSVNQKKTFYSILAHYASTVKIGEPEKIRFAERIEVAMFYDIGETKKSQSKSKEYIGNVTNRKSDHFERLLWLYMLSAQATKQDIDTPAKLGLDTWKKGITHIDKLSFALTLSKLLESNKQNKECMLVLKESTKTTVKNSSHYTQLKTMLERKSKGEHAVANFNKALDNWMLKHKPIWYDHLPLKSLDDPKLPPIDELIAGKQGELHTLEFIKGLLLATQSINLPLEKREGAYCAAVNRIYAITSNWEDANNFVFDSISLELLSDSVNMQIIWPSYINASSNGKIEHLDKFLKHPAYQLLRKELKEEIGPDRKAICKFIANQDPSGALKIAREISRKKLSENYRISSLMFLYSQFATFGMLDEMEVLRKDAKNWVFDSATKPGKLESRLQMSQTAKMAKIIIPITSKLEKDTRTLLEKKAQNAPENWKNFRNPAEFSGFTPQQRESIKSAQVLSKSGYDCTALSHWFVSGSFWQHSKNEVNAPLLLLALENILESELDDDIKNYAIITIIAIGADSPSIGKIVYKKLNDELKSHQSNGNIKALHLLSKQSVQFGTDQEVSINSLIAQGGSGSFLQVISDYVALGILLHQQDIKGLQSFIDKANSDTLIDPMINHRIIKALQLCEDEDTLELVAEYAEEQIRDNVLDCWESASLSIYQRACEVALLIGKKDLIPAVWSKHVLSSLTPYEREEAQIITCFKNGQWQETIHFADKVLQRKGMEHEKRHAKYFKAVAMKNLGDDQGAKPLFTELAEINPSSSEYSYLAAQQLTAVAKPATKKE
jgi:tetratricopeptide (TPR) repeat protein